MKGNVATRMGTNELMITELVFRNVLQHKQPAEIAALLSGLVFQAKAEQDPNVPILEKVSWKKTIWKSHFLNQYRYILKY